MSGARNQAVFLSYASQDVESAKRICDALRAVGVEVWFDQSELVGGDQWDQKIRGQVKSCTLFVPIISTATQVRLEGYFRLEWKLAAQRTHTMADAKPFLLPVVIDATRDAEAHVPEEFRAVQWTRIGSADALPAFCERVKALLGGDRRDASPSLPSSEAGGNPGRLGEPSRLVKPGRRVPAAAWIAALAVVSGAVLYFTLRPGKNAGGAAALSTPTRPPAAEKNAAPLSEARQLVAKAWVQLIKSEVGRAELEVADDFCKRAAALDATDADVWAAWSQVESWYVFARTDSTPARRESARTKAARALQLSPESYEARLAQACYLQRCGNNWSVSLFPTEADALLRQLLQEQPEEPRALMVFSTLAAGTGKLDEARTAVGRLAKQPAFAAQALSGLGWMEWFFARDPRAAELAVDASIAREPMSDNLTLKYMVALYWRGDFALAQATLDRLPSAVQQADFGVSTAYDLHYWRRDVGNMLRVLDGVSRDWLRSTAFDGPKAWMSGLAQELAGRSEAAQLQWRTALHLVERRLAEQPDSAELLCWKCRLQAKTGDPKGAETTLRLAEGTSIPGVFQWWWSVRDQIFLGKRDAALTLMEQAAEQRAPIMSLANCQLNPSWDDLRDEPRFKALLTRLAADPKMSPHATPPEKAAVRK